jgi:hypothetical protein
MKAVKLGAVLLGTSLVLSGCSSPTTHNRAFSKENIIKGNSEPVPAPVDIAWESVLGVMSEHGWILQQADSASHLVLAQKEIRDGNNKDLSHSITATVTLVPMSKQITRITMAANMTTELHESSHTWFRLLWLVPLFPTGMEYNTVVINRDTVYDVLLYQDFFTAVKEHCAAIKEVRGSDLPEPEQSPEPVKAPTSLDMLY